MSTDAPHILAEHRRSPLLDELFVVDLDVHVNDTPADLAPFCELPWRKSLEALEKVPQRYLVLADDEVPMLSSGKLDARALKERFGAG